MFGTIGRVRVKPGHEAELQALMHEWWQTIRPQLPGPFVELIGRSQDRPDELLFIALTQDEATYRALAELPEQDAHFRRELEHFEGEPSWEDVELELVGEDGSGLERVIREAAAST